MFFLDLVLSVSKVFATSPHRCFIAVIKFN